MPSFSSLRRSRPSVLLPRLIQRHHTCQFSNSPPPPLINANAHHEHRHAYRSFSRWISTIAAGSSLALLYFSVTDSESSSVFSFADFSTTTFESTVNNWCSDPAFRKLSLPNYTTKFLFGDAYRRKVFFNYEKRIRLRSPPEKIFEYFASFQAPDGELLMRPMDLMRAVVPVFPPSESHLVRGGYLEGERNPGELRCPPSKFFMLFDVNNDGLISFKEYIFFVTLLSIPESSFSVVFKMFDIDNSGEIDKGEFKKVMELMRARNRQGAVHRDGLRLGLKVHDSVENGGLLEYFFGKDGKGRLHHEKFVRFMRDLHDEMLQLEFAHYDYKLQGTISAKDFALSMVASADINHLDTLVDRAEELNDVAHLKDIRITFDEFKNFSELRKRLLPFSLALFSYGKVIGLLTKEDFQRAASHVCGISLTDNVVDIIFHVFDSNVDGNLSSNEFVRVLQQRQRDISQPVESGMWRFLPCCWNCGNNGSMGQLLP